MENSGTTRRQRRRVLALEALLSSCLHLTGGLVTEKWREGAEQLGRSESRRSGRQRQGRAYSEDLDRFVLNEGMEETDGVGSASDAGDNGVREPADLLQHLSTRLLADDRLEVADDGGEGMGADGGADDVVCVPHVGNPVAHGLIDGILGEGKGRDEEKVGGVEQEGGRTRRIWRKFEPANGEEEARGE
eukprot:753688-Hanusia_phi.AAC.1